MSVREYNAARLAEYSFKALRPLFFYFLVYGFLGGKNGSVGRKKLIFFSKGPTMSSCRKKLPVHGNSIKK